MNRSQNGVSIGRILLRESSIKMDELQESTKSQAVARIADRTAKNSMGHVTYRPRPVLVVIFVRPLGILHSKLHTKFEVSSSSSFRDIAL